MIMHTETSDFDPNKSIDYYRAKSSEDQFQRTYVPVKMFQIERIFSGQIACTLIFNFINCNISVFLCLLQNVNVADKPTRDIRRSS